MAHFDEETLEHSIIYLLDAKLGPYLTWQIPALCDQVGPADTSVFKSFDDHRRRVVEACDKRLRSYSAEKIRVLCQHPINDPYDVQNEWKGFLNSEVYHLSKKEPVWYAGGFGHPGYRADFDYWAKMLTFNTVELVCLSIGFEPESLPEDVVSQMKRGKEAARTRPLKFLFRRYELLKRRFDPQGLRSGCIDLPVSV